MRRQCVTRQVVAARIGPGAPGEGPIDGPAAGRFVAGIVAGPVTSGASLHLESADQPAGLP